LGRFNSEGKNVFWYGYKGHLAIGTSSQYILQSSDCPLANEGICQKVYKVKITTDLRRYTVPARGSKVWKHIYKRRSPVERVNAYLKEYYQLDNVRYRTGKRTKVHFDIVTLVYNVSKLASDRINLLLNQQQAA